MRILAIVQARMNSSRLPGKVLKDIAGQPMLVRVVERVRRAKQVTDVVVATTTDPSDDPIEALCRERGTMLSRGSMFDVLDRFYQAARHYEADVIVRVTADCPVIDPDVVDRTVDAFFDQQADFACNRLPPPWKRTWPIGLDTEVCSFAGLERAWKEAQLPHEREHVMPYFYDQEGRFKVVVVDHDVDYGSLRWTVDTAEDLHLLREIFARFEGSDTFSWLDVLALMEREPQLGQINASVRHKVGTEVDDRAQKNSLHENDNSGREGSAGEKV
jgi:spore coat polysaccharide biosynthesis protein SpsF